MFFSVVASIKTTWGGGSSSDFKNALKAAFDSMWTSSIIYTLNFPYWGGILICSVIFLISSTELFDAASSSNMLYSKFSSKSFIFLARILAQDVLPTPLGPQNKRAWGIFWLSIAFDNVFTIASCPIISLKSLGLYSEADDIDEFSINNKYKNWKKLLTNSYSFFIKIINMYYLCNASRLIADYSEESPDTIEQHSG